ncbi:MAG: ribonuclease R [Parvularcula sp.]
MTAIPSPDDIRAYVDTFIARGEGAPTRRDIAKAFGLKGPERAALRRLLTEMEDQRLITLDGKRARPRGTLPPVVVLDAHEIDEDGDLLCTVVTPPEDVHIPPILLEARVAAKTKPPIGMGTRFLGRLTPTQDQHLSVKPLKVFAKGKSRALGLFEQDRRGGRVRPVNRKQRETWIIDPHDTGGAKDGELVWVEPKNQRGYGPRRARVVDVVGDISQSKNWSLIALAEQDIPIEFPPAVVEAARQAKMPDRKNYEDLTSLPFITIDPATAKDHDDAVLVRTKDKGFEVLVAIADVSGFVQPGTDLDREARARGNSVYLVDRVVPMLPETLSNGLCSLKAGEDRPALVCEMQFSADGHKTSHRFVRAMIRCRIGLSYEEAQAAADGQLTDRTSPYADTVIRPLFDAYERISKAQQKEPSLDLDLPEREIRLGEDGQVASIRVKDRFAAHKLIETMMVAANVCAAETLEEKHRPLIYRVHEPPNEERLDGLRSYLESIGYSLPKGQSLRPIAFNRILKKAAANDQLEMVSMAILRAQSQAIYSTENAGHFGLNLSRYTHFTSPIRRYADLTVHRGLVAALGLGPGGQTAADEKELDLIADAISLTERRAIAAERATQDRFLAAYLEPKMGADFPARVSGMAGAGLFVTLDEIGADGFIPMRSLPGDYYIFDEATTTMVGRHTKAAYVIGQRVDVRLVEVTPVQGGLRFEMLTEPQRTPKKGKPEHAVKQKVKKKKTKSKPKARKKPAAKPSAQTPASAVTADGVTLRRKPRKKQ